MNKYFINRKEVTYRTYLQSNEADKLQFPAEAQFYYDGDGKLIRVNDEWISMAPKRNFKESDLLYAVATFNADPYLVEDDGMVTEIMLEIEVFGANEVTDNDEREVALAKLDLPADSKRIVYKAGGCLFSMDGDEY